jgi:hypothetical protein
LDTPSMFLFWNLTTRSTSPRFMTNQRRPPISLFFFFE